jgi:DNA-directed RNA polymerase subunit RPC12/RpoP
MSKPHYRRCWECGAINLHSDNVTPEVCCKRCGSRDTRLMKNEPPLWTGTIGEKRGLYVPDEVAKCPECKSSLIAECIEHEAETGRPVATGIELDCIQFLSDSMYGSAHSYRQSDWQPVRDAVVKWCDARQDYPPRRITKSTLRDVLRDEQK